jgi:hypothetical protein
MKGQNAHLNVVPRGGFPSSDASAYDRKKARAIAGCLIASACRSEQVTLRELPKLAARMSNDEWRAVAFQAGVAVPDLAAKRATVAYLLEVAA